MISNPPQRPESDAVTLKIVQKVAESKGIDPQELTPPLYSAIDTEALNDLFESTKNGPRSGSVTFEYNGCTVQVETTDAIEVDILEVSC
ncbi:HalOD1 output domain-containing protein [Natrarchaeobius halalkaliphilus]|uniref:HalOD1 output domain-containing protein n=1 Tax=Natrarchaeobius halalkaliphilus TaxID=1679091 RepID=UPI000F5239E2|nr:HalOD1 output domain-containing protein [Natrarchaeobius halalkaliphilus]